VFFIFLFLVTFETITCSFITSHLCLFVYHLYYIILYVLCQVFYVKNFYQYYYNIIYKQLNYCNSFNLINFFSLYAFYSRHNRFCICKQGNHTGKGSETNLKHFRGLLDDINKKCPFSGANDRR